MGTLKPDIERNIASKTEGQTAYRCNFRTYFNTPFADKGLLVKDCFTAASTSRDFVLVRGSHHNTKEQTVSQQKPNTLQAASVFLSLPHVVCEQNTTFPDCTSCKEKHIMAEDSIFCSVLWDFCAHNTSLSCPGSWFLPSPRPHSSSTLTLRPENSNGLDQIECSSSCNLLHIQFRQNGACI